MCAPVPHKTNAKGTTDGDTPKEHFPDNTSLKKGTIATCTSSSAPPRRQTPTRLFPPTNPATPQVQ